MEHAPSKEKISALLSSSTHPSPEIFTYAETDSTNLRARVWASEHPENRETKIFIASSQSAGRGRKGRSFSSERGGIYLSLLLYPDAKGFDATAITAYSAVKLCEAIEALSTARPLIKWVNDLYLDGRKIAGILAEGVMGSDGKIAYLVLGMGINVYKREFPDDISHIAGSIEAVTGERLCLDTLAAKIIECVLHTSASPDSEECFLEYRRRCGVVGREVTVIRASEQYHATVLGLERDYSLLIRRQNGECERLFTGEVSTKMTPPECAKKQENKDCS